MVFLLLFLFIATAATAYFSTYQVKRLAERIGCIDRPDDRKLHLADTPRLGGLAIIAGFAIPLMLVPIHPHAASLVSKNLAYLFGLLTSGSLIIALGIYDDLYGSNATKKFTVQISAAIVLVAFGFHFDSVFIPGMGNVDLGWLGMAVTIVWIVGVINAVNFIDGMDSLATAVGFTIAISFATISLIRGDMLALVVMTALAGSLAGFFPWNRAPARIFMGDSGSLFIGLLLAASSIARESKAPTMLIVGGPILALALPVIDTLFVMKGRFSGDDTGTMTRLGRFNRMFSADRSHIHHILIEKYGSPTRVVVSIWLLTLLFGIAAVITLLPSVKEFGYLLGLVTLLVMVGLRLRGRRSEDESIEMSPEHSR